MADRKVADAGGPASTRGPRPRRLPLWLYYQWGTSAIAEPVEPDLQGAQRMLQGLIDLYDLPGDGTWSCRTRGSQ